MTFINFNNKNKPQESEYSAEVIKEALYSVETKNTKKIEATLSSVKEPLTISEALKFFSDKIKGLSALQEAKKKVTHEGKVTISKEDMDKLHKDGKVKIDDTDVEFVDEAAKAGQWVGYITYSRGNKLEKTFKSHRAAVRWQNKNTDSILMQDGVKGMGTMSKEEWDQKEAPYAIKEDKLTWDGLLEKINEKVIVDVGRYLMAHDKKPKGFGTWMFSYDKDGDLGNSFEVPKPMKWQDASKWAQKKAKKDNKSAVYVLESVNEKSINKIQKEWSKVTSEMKTTVDEWKEAEGKEKEQLKTELKKLTAKKKEIEAQLDSKVGLKDAGTELVGEARGQKIDADQAVEALEAEAEELVDIEEEAAEALEYIAGRIDQTNSGKDITMAEIRELLKDPRAKKYTKVLSEDILEDIFKTAGIYEANFNQLDKEDYSDEMSYGQLESCIDNSNMIRKRIEQGASLDPWMHSQIAVAKNDLTSVFDALDGDDGVVEATPPRNPRYFGAAGPGYRRTANSRPRGVIAGRSRSNSFDKLRQTIKDGSVVIPYGHDKYGEFIIDDVFLNRYGETSYTGKFKKSGEEREFILNSKDELVKESIVNEAKFYRIDPKVRDNELWRSYLNIKSFYESLTNGNDVDLKVLNSIIKNLQKVKKSIKGFNSSDEVMGTVYETVSPIDEAKKMGREDIMIWLEDYVDEARTSEEFDGTKGGIWVSTYDANQYKGNLIYNYFSKGDRKYENGVLKDFEKELNKRGWSSSWHDDETVIIETK